MSNDDVIKTLSISLSPRAKIFLDRCNQVLAPDHIRLTVGYRDSVDQERALAEGLSQAGAGQSPHNCINANGQPAARGFDFAVIDAKGNYISQGEDRRYAVCGHIAETFGLVWGANFPKPDWDHVQLPSWRIGATFG